MQVLAIIDIVPGAHLETIRAELATEIKGSWRLYEAGILREAYATSSPTRVVFVLEAEDEKAAHGHLQTLPLIAGGLMRVDVIALRPFVNWSVLFAR